MEIEVDLYSGRPNPRVPVGPVASAELLALLADLPDAAGPPPSVPGLGYRGLVVRVGAERGSGPAEIVVSGGRAVTRTPGRADRVQADAGRGVERRIVEAVAGSLDAPSLASVRAALPGPET